jgi:hypothetical protein
MSRCRWICALFIALAANAIASPSSIELVEQFGDYRLVAFIEASDIDNSPEWNPAVDAPPLSINEAILSAAQLGADSVMPGDVREIDIRPVPGHTGRWHYLIKFVDEERQPGFSFYVVLMNGKVIPAIVEPGV